MKKINNLFIYFYCVFIYFYCVFIYFYFVFYYFYFIVFFILFIFIVFLFIVFIYCFYLFVFYVLCFSSLLLDNLLDNLLWLGRGCRISNCTSYFRNYCLRHDCCSSRSRGRSFKHRCWRCNNRCWSN